MGGGFFLRSYLFTLYLKKIEIKKTWQLGCFSLGPLVICEWSLLFLASYGSTAQWHFDNRAIFSFFRLPFSKFVFSHLISLDAWPCIAGELHRVARHRRNWRRHQSWGNGNFHIFTIFFHFENLLIRGKIIVSVVSTEAPPTCQFGTFG